VTHRRIRFEGKTTPTRYELDEVALHNDGQDDGFDSIIMSQEDLHEVCRQAPPATIVASHMEAVYHATLTRSELRRYLLKHELTQRVLMPEDGEAISLQARAQAIRA
jgi:hypothetical protein